MWVWYSIVDWALFHLEFQFKGTFMLLLSKHYDNHHDILEYELKFRLLYSANVWWRKALVKLVNHWWFAIQI